MVANVRWRVTRLGVLAVSFLLLGQAADAAQIKVQVSKDMAVERRQEDCGFWITHSGFAEKCEEIEILVEQLTPQSGDQELAVIEFDPWLHVEDYFYEPLAGAAAHVAVETSAVVSPEPVTPEPPEEDELTVLLQRLDSEMGVATSPRSAKTLINQASEPIQDEQMLPETDVSKTTLPKFKLSHQNIKPRKEVVSEIPENLKAQTENGGNNAPESPPASTLRAGRAGEALEPSDEEQPLSRMRSGWKTFKRWASK